MNRTVYLLFGGPKFYARGGVEDFIRSSESLDELKRHGETLHGTTVDAEFIFGNTTGSVNIDWLQIAAIQDCQLVPLLCYDAQHGWRGPENSDVQ